MEFKRLLKKGKKTLISSTYTSGYIVDLASTRLMPLCPLNCLTSWWHSRSSCKHSKETLLFHDDVTASQGCCIFVNFTCTMPISCSTNTHNCFNCLWCGDYVDHLSTQGLLWCSKTQLSDMFSSRIVFQWKLKWNETSVSPFFCRSSLAFKQKDKKEIQEHLNIMKKRFALTLFSFWWIICHLIPLW